jgi:hypothetical protein
MVPVVSGMEAFGKEKSYYVSIRLFPYSNTLLSGVMFGVDCLLSHPVNIFCALIV